MRIRTVFALALLVSLGTVAASQINAQGGGPSLRTVHGTVVDKKDNPVPSSIVYLLNTSTQAVKTYIADNHGAYRFSGLDPNVDYELHAEKGDMISPSRTISRFDSRRDIEVVLKLSRKKKAR